MKKRMLFVTLTLGLSLTSALLWLLASQSPSAVAAPSAGNVEVPNAPADELHVCAAGSPTCDFASVQAAVDAAGYEDVIKVAAGTYTDIHVRDGITQVVYINRDTVTIQGGYTTTNWTTPDPEANPTILDAQGQGRVFYIHCNGVTIEGLHITGGDATGMGDGPPYCSDPGGGVQITSDHTATISDNWIYDNVADCGGGLWLNCSDSVLTGNMIFSNTAQYSGGGVYEESSQSTLSENAIISNTAGDSGGGLLLGGSPTLVNNVIADNQTNDGHGGTGSGLAVVAGDPSFVDNAIALVHNTIARNQGGDSSGVGVFDFFEPYVGTVTLTNTVFADQSVGINIESSGVCTVTVNGVLWHNVPITVSQSTTGTVSVQNEYSGDPAFAPDGYHITAVSAAIDKGVDAGITVDIDGEPRPYGEGYDLGADEFWLYEIYLPLIIRNY